LSALVFLPILLILFYLLLIRPQQQRARAQQRLMSSIGVGDRIVTIGGIIGTIAELRGDHVVVEMVDGARVEFLRQAVSRKIEDAMVTDLDTDTDDLGDDEGEGEWWEPGDEEGAAEEHELATDDGEPDDLPESNGSAASSNGHAPIDAEARSQSEEDSGNR